MSLYRSSSSKRLIISDAEPAEDTPSCAHAASSSLLEGLKKSWKSVFFFSFQNKVIIIITCTIIPFLIQAISALCPQQHANLQVVTCHLDDLKSPWGSLFLAILIQLCRRIQAMEQKMNRTIHWRTGFYRWCKEKSQMINLRNSVVLK